MGLISDSIDGALKIGGAIAGFVNARKMKKKAGEYEDKANAVNIEEVDPSIVTLRNKINQRVDRLNTGAINSANNTLINRAVSGTTDAATSLAYGGSSGATAVLRSLSQKGDMIGKAQAANAQLEQGLTLKGSQLTEDIAQRKLETRLLERSRNDLKAQTASGYAQKNFQGAVASLSSGVGDIASSATSGLDQKLTDKLEAKRKLKGES